MNYTPNTLQKWSMPSSYAGAEWPDYYGAGFGQSRDSDALERSNFAVVVAALAKLPAFESDELDESGDEINSRQVVREGHWAVGWVEWIAIHKSDTEALKLCDEFAASVENYPVLDDEHCSQTEEADADQTWKNCYSWKERAAYMRKFWNQFDHAHGQFRYLRAIIKGEYFGGYASELLY